MELAELSTDACWALLRTAAVGRVALIRGGLPTVLPVNICAEDGAVWFRVGRGPLLDSALAGHVLSVETDEVDRVTHTGWSVLATGRADVAADRPELPLAPWGNPGADHLVRVDAELLTGRRLGPAHVDADVPR